MDVFEVEEDLIETEARGFELCRIVSRANDERSDDEKDN
jgi:hypothetical protein